MAPESFLVFIFNLRTHDDREDKWLHERANIEMQNHENENLSKQSRGKEKESDSKCSWSLLSGTSDGGSESTYSHSNDYSGPSWI